MIKVASLPISVDLKLFSQLLHQQGLIHRINEESGQQVIWAQSEVEAELIRQALAQWSRQPAEFRAKTDAMEGRGFDPGPWLFKAAEGLRHSPITWILILISTAVAVMSGLGSQLRPVADWFYPLLPASSLASLLSGIDSVGELLRTVTPIFLHFGELHFVFNMMWLWYFGRQLESLQPRWFFVILVLVTAFVSNTTQYLVIEYNNFGGMSGVDYGLLAYAWVIHFFMPRSGILMNNSMFLFFVVALVVMEIVAGSWIATAAHVSGLLTGLIIGLFVVVFYKVVLKRTAMGKS